MLHVNAIEIGVRRVLVGGSCLCTHMPRLNRCCINWTIGKSRVTYMQFVYYQLTIRLVNSCRSRNVVYGAVVNQCEQMCGVIVSIAVGLVQVVVLLYFEVDVENYA